MNREEKRKIRLRICSLLETECKGCEHHHGQNTHIHCQTECPVGRSLLMYSKKLVGELVEGPKEIITKPIPVKSGPWSSEEEFYLMNHIKIFTSKHLAKRLNRSPTSVVAKISAFNRKHEKLVVY